MPGSSTTAVSIIKPDESGLSLLIPIISVIGIIGNCTVLVVYLKKMRNTATNPSAAGRSLANIFIATLAVNDLVACVVVMPLTLIYELAPSLVFTTNVSCKLYYLFTASVIPFSAFLMTAISIDRYLCICQPLKKILTPMRARIAVVVLAITATTMGTLVAIQYSAQMVNPNETVSDMLDTTTMIMMQNLTSDVSTALYEMSAGAGDEAEAEAILAATSTHFNLTDDYITTTYAGEAAAAAASWPAGGCITEPVLGDFFEQSYHYIHNTITFVVALALTFTFYALIYSRIWARHMQKARKAKATSRALQNTSQAPTSQICAQSSKQTTTTTTTDGGGGCEMTTVQNCSDDHQPTADVSNDQDDHQTQFDAEDDRLVPSSQPTAVAANGAEVLEKKASSSIKNVTIIANTNTNNNNNSGSAKNRRQSLVNKQSFKIGNELGTQVRLAAMLFVVTVVFTLSYVPAFLANYTSLFGDPENDPWNRFVFYIYFVNNAANPLIYGIMNKNFREDLRQLCCGQNVRSRGGAGSRSNR